MKKRKILNKILKEVDNKYILLLLWARQVWKTTLLKEIQKIKKDTINFFINIEDPRIKEALNRHPNNIFEITGSNKNEKQIIFLDEIQYLDDPTNFLKYIYDEYSENIKLIVSWSSSFYIDKKFKDSLVWRKKIFNIYTLDFFEFLDFKWESKLKDTILKSNKIPLLFKDDLNNLFLEYIKYWWYPEIVLIKNRDEKVNRLKEYALDYIKKDIFEAKIEDQDKFLNLLKILASQTWELVNSNELANTLSLTAPTINKYLYVMQKSFYIALIKPFYNNIRKELTKMPKVFFYDLWIRNALINNFENIDYRFDKWWYLENIVFREFLFKYNSIDNIKFWRTQNKNEVDFIINSSLAYEVKFSEKQIKTSKYKVFNQNYPEITLNYITYEDILERIILSFKENI